MQIPLQVRIILCFLGAIIVCLSVKLSYFLGDWMRAQAIFPFIVIFFQVIFFGFTAKLAMKMIIRQIYRKYDIADMNWESGYSFTPSGITRNISSLYENTAFNYLMIGYFVISALYAIINIGYILENPMQLTNNYYINAVAGFLVFGMLWFLWC